MLNDIYNHFGKGLFWVFQNQITTTIVALTTIVILANMFSPEVFGQYRYLTSLGIVIVSLNLSGMNIAITQAAARGLEGNYFRAILKQFKWTLLSYLLAIIISLFYSWRGNTELSFGVFIVGIMLPFISVINSYKAFLLGKSEFKTIFFMGLINSIAPLAGMLIAATLSPELLPLLIFTLTLTLLSNTACFLYAWRKFPPNKKKDPGLIAFGKKISFLNILSIIAQYFDIFIVFHFLGSNSLALYSLTIAFPEQIRTFLRMVPTLTISKISSESPKMIQATLKQRLIAFFIVISLIVAAYSLVLPRLIPLLFPNYLQIISLIPMSAFLIYASLSDYLESFLTSKKKAGELTLLVVARFIMTLVLTVSFGYLYGIKGLIIARILTYFLITLLEKVILDRFLEKSAGIVNSN